MTQWHMEQVIEPALWEQTLQAFAQPHVLQSWEWGAFKERWGWQAERLLWRQNSTPVALAQILHRRIPGSPWRFLYVAKGPILDQADAPLVTQVLADLETHARQVGSIFIKIDPDVPRAYGPPQAAPSPDLVGQAWLTLLARRGWRYSPEQIQFRNTWLLDLEPGLDDLLQKMKSKWRYNIRLAKRKGVVIRAGGGQDIEHFYQMYAETAARDNFLIRPAAYYQDVWQRFMALDQAELLLAAVGDELVAGLMLFYCGSTAWYLYGASTGQHRRLMPNHLLQWQAMQQAKSHGCVRYDMWGAPDVFAESDRMWGVYRFKQGFGGQVFQGLGAFDFPVNRTLYWSFTQALPRIRGLLRRLKR